VEFTVKDFDSVFTRHDSDEYRKLVSKVGDEWGRLWAKYVDWKEKRGEPLKLERKGRVPSMYKGEHLVRFLEYVLKIKERQDWIILIFLTQRLRGSLRKEYTLFGPNEFDNLNMENDLVTRRIGLCWLLLQWRDQVDSICEEDALTSALIRMEFPPQQIAWAEITHARRMRAGIGSPRVHYSKHDQRDKAERKKIEIAERLLNDAERLITSLGEDDEEIEQFCYFQPNGLISYIKLQRALNLSRSGNQRKAAEMAEKLIERGPLAHDSEGPTDSSKYFQWWCLHILIRAASASVDSSKFSEFSGKMKELEESLGGELGGYFKAYHATDLEWVPNGGNGRMVRVEDANGYKETKQYKLITAFRNWHAFYGDGTKEDSKDSEKRGEDYRPLYSRRKSPSSEQRDFCGEVGLKQEKHEGFHTFHSIVHDGSRGKKFQPLRKTLGDQKAFQKRIRKMLQEIDEAHFASLRRMDQHTCVILEILGRELVYRLWFEVIKMPLHSNWTMKSLEPEILQSIRVLKRIKDGIVCSRAFERDEDEFIDDFIEFLEKNNRKNMEDKLEVKGFRYELRKIMNEHDKKGDKKFKNKYVDSFLGIPYMIGEASMMRNQHSFLERSHFY
jgi:hypothetical protein